MVERPGSAGEGDRGGPAPGGPVHRVTIVGLGFGRYRHLTLEAAEALQAAPALILRTARHPAVAEFPPSLRWQSCDDLYEAAADFPSLYAAIARRVLEAASASDVVYAVPGDPCLGEESVRRLLQGAQEAGVPVRLVNGVSFIEPALAALGCPPGDSLQVLDALAPPTFSPTTPALFYQVHSRAVASELKLALLELYPGEHEVVVLRGAGLGADQRMRRLRLAELDHRDEFDDLTTLYVPPLAPEANYATMDGLHAIIRRLRGPGGCPWDREQTHASLRPYVLEEAYEVADAIDREDWAELAAELGDLALQVSIQTAVAEEAGEFTLADVFRAVTTKLIRRHPHVFGDVQVSGSAQVVRNWEAIKREERPEQTSVLDGMPRSLPALLAAQEISRRVVRVGFEWPSVEAVLAKVQEELSELMSAPDEQARLLELGDVLFSVVNLGRKLGVSAEDALRATNREFTRRFQALEAECRARGVAVEQLSLAELEAIWQRVKYG